MKLSISKLLAVTLCSIIAMGAVAATYTAPKREMRSAWVATVWGLDWPKTTISSTGNTTQVAAQKQEMITLLDSMAANNINAINFQVRSRCDAMYKSSYEPWSSDLVSTRGLDPGYDPLAFVVQECHKRGIECHAWINPYRYESVTGQWTGGAGDYRTEHPDWIIDYNGASILNPGKAEVIQRIVDVCKEIVTNYDIDGLLYDDYFYLNGTPYSADTDLYSAYTTAGGTLSQADWRRNNVNTMVKSVYSMIQTVKPWVRFGISPAGVACTSASLASKYGITACPSGSDWQYSGIYSDPVAWLKNKTLDFISPQIYWTIGSSNDYSKIAPWWSTVAAHFGRHFYSSHSISSLTSNSTGTYAPAVGATEAGTSTLEKTLSVMPKASGDNSTSYNEYANEIEINRSSTQNDAPGSIFYSCKYLYNMGAKESFAHFLKRTVFANPALLPVMTWKAGNNPGMVKNITKSAYTLSWTGYDNVRYSIYAVPDTVSQASFDKEGKYLMGTSYLTTFDIPADKRTGYQYAVCVLDRMGNEYSPLFLGASAQQLAAPTLVAPAAGAKVEDPFVLQWNAVPNATDYTVEIASDAAFKNITRTAATQSTTLSSLELGSLTPDVVQYWRVHACAANYNDGISEGRAFTPQILTVTYPADQATDIWPTFDAKWSLSNGSDEATFEISTDANFADGTIVFSGKSVNGTINVPLFVLQTSTQYFAHVAMTRNGATKVSDAITFYTRQFDADVPEFTQPLEGGTLYADQHIQLARQMAALTMTIEISSSETVWGRTRFVETLKDFNYQTTLTGSTLKVDGSALVDGKTYYARALAAFINKSGTKESTAYCDPIAFTYSSNTGIANVGADKLVKIISGETPMLFVSLPTSKDMTVTAISTLGTIEKELYRGNATTLEIPLDNLSRGLHLIRVNMGGTVKTLKFIR